MESTNVESQEPLLRDQTQTSSKLKQEVAPQSPFHTGSKMPYRDSTFTFLFLTAILTTFTFGIIASTRTDSLNMDTKLHLSNYNPTTNKCEITQQQTPKPADSDPNPVTTFVKLLALTSLFALALTVPLSLLLVSLLRRYTHTLVRLSAPMLSLFFLGLGLSMCLLEGLSWSSQCLDVHGVWGVVPCRGKQIFDMVFQFCVPPLLAHIIWKDWKGSSLQNGVEVLRIATGFWKEHFVLLVVNPVLLVGAMVVVNGPIFTLMWYAFNVGEIVPDFDVVNDPMKGCGLAAGSRCCREERPGWVYAYITFAGLTAFWVFTVSMVLQDSVVSGTVSLWYFTPVGSSANGNIKHALGNAYGPSFGIACNCGTVVTTIIGEYLRRLKNILNSDHEGMMLSIFRRCFSWMSQFPKCSPQLRSIYLGILDSSKKSHYTLLQRTSPVSIAEMNSDGFVDGTLWGMISMCILPQTLVVCGVLAYFSNAFVGTKIMVTGLCSSVITIGLLIGFSMSVKSVITTVYVCYVLERDKGKTISKPELCHAFMTNAPSLPENGA